MTSASTHPSQTLFIGPTCVPIWVPDPRDPNGLEGSWQHVDPRSPNVDPKRVAQAHAVAELWASNKLPAVA